jgi:hypothetical protein
MNITKIEQKVNQIDVYELDVTAIELHKFAYLTPRMTDLDYQALKRDIETNGQKDPGVLFRGKLIDGRHRWWILQELGVPTMKVTKMPSNSTNEELMSTVYSKETRRHDSVSQKAIMAYNYIQQATESITHEAAATLFGVHRKRIGEAKQIDVKFGRRDILDLIFRGEKFNVGTAKIPRPSDSLYAIINWLEENGTFDASSKYKELELGVREELTDDEQMWVTKIMSYVSKEREAVRKAIANKIYTELVPQERSDEDSTSQQ